MNGRGRWRLRFLRKWRRDGRWSCGDDHCRPEDETIFAMRGKDDRITAPAHTPTLLMRALHMQHTPRQKFKQIPSQTQSTRLSRPHLVRCHVLDKMCATPSQTDRTKANTPPGQRKKLQVVSHKDDGRTGRYTSLFFSRVRFRREKAAVSSVQRPRHVSGLCLQRWCGFCRGAGFETGVYPVRSGPPCKCNFDFPRCFFWGAGRRFHIVCCWYGMYGGRGEDRTGHPSPLRW